MEDGHVHAIPISKIEPMEDLSTFITHSKKRKTRSRVWDEYKPIFKDGKIDGAYCNHCHMRLSAKPTSGTSHLGRHLLKCSVRNGVHPLPPSCQRQASPCQSQKQPSYQTQCSFSEGCSIETKECYFDQQKSSEELAKMLIAQKLPFSLVEHDAFRSFVLALNPMFKTVSHSSTENDCIALFGKEKMKLKDKIDISCDQISIAGTIWTHSEMGQFLVFTSQFIDQEWNLYRKIIKFAFVNFETSGAFGKHFDSTRGLTNEVWKTIRDWNLDQKLFSITWDDTETSDEVVNRLAEKLGKNKLPLKGKLFSAPCLHHVVNLVEDYWREFDMLVDCVKRAYNRIRVCSLLHIRRFKEIASKLGLKFSLVGLAHWYSTYFMLELFLYFRKTLPSFLNAEDIEYLNQISCDDVKLAESICKLLKVFYHASNIFSDHGASNIYFNEMWKLRKTLQEASSCDDEAFAGIVKDMQVKFDKFWRHSFLWLSLPVVLDPRFKIEYINFRFKQAFGFEASKYISEVRSAISGLCFEYCSNDDKHNGYFLGCGDHDTDAMPDTCDSLEDWDQYLSVQGSDQYAPASRQAVVEVDKFFADPLLPREEDFDILKWWKIHSMQYPMLARVARQILSVPMFSIPAATIFSGIEQSISQSHNSAGSDTIEALICLQDWTRASGVADVSGDMDDFRITV